MLSQARAKIARLGLSDRVHFKQGNARELPYPDETFVLTYNSYMFDLIPLADFVPILEEFHRVLKPGGKLVLVNMSKPGERKTLYERGYRGRQLLSHNAGISCLEQASLSSKSVNSGW